MIHIMFGRKCDLECSSAKGRKKGQEDKETKTHHKKVLFTTKFRNGKTGEKIISEF